MAAAGAARAAPRPRRRPAGGAGGAATSGKAEAAAPAAEEDDGTGWRGRIGVVAPSMSEHGAASLSLHGLGDGRGGRGEASSPSGSGGGSGLENLKEKLKYGRPSLRSELMKQILSGVAHQMDRLAEEDGELCEWPLETLVPFLREHADARQAFTALAASAALETYDA